MSDSYAWIQKLQATEEGRTGGVAGWWEWGGGITVEAVAAIFLMTDCGEARRRSIVCPDL